jgi:integrase
MKESGWTALPVVQELLRHANLKVTTDVYMQAVGPQKREAQNNLVRLVRKGFDSEAKSS